MADGGGENVDSMSEELFDYICTICDRENKTVEAVKYCTDCKDYCCQSCTDSHKKFTPLFGPSFLDVGQGNQSGTLQNSSPEFPTERCCVHKGQIVDMYCETCDTVGCSTLCISKDHKSCPQRLIHSVPDILNIMFKLSDIQQTKRHVRETLASIGSLVDSTDVRLEALNKAKKAALDEIEKFQKVLENVLRKVAESSRIEVDKVYKSLKDEIFQQKHDIESTAVALQENVKKIDKAAANRAQKFVCSKLAETNIKKAEKKMTKQLNADNINMAMSFHPNNELKEYMKGLHGLGKVEVAKTKNKNLYKVKGGGDIIIRVNRDTSDCNTWGCCLTDDHQLLVTDENNKKVKRFDAHTLLSIDHCTLDSIPRGVCLIGNREYATACSSSNKIQFVSLANKMKPTRKIKTSHGCHGIAMKHDNLYVTDGIASLYVYDMTGTKLRTITHDTAGDDMFKFTNITHIAFNELGTKMFVGNFNSGFVCFDGVGKFLSAVNDDEVVCIIGVCNDNNGNIFVAGFNSDNVVQFNEDGEKVGVVVKKGDGITLPSSVCFSPSMNRLFVTMLNSNILKMYELE